MTSPGTPEITAAMADPARRAEARARLDHLWGRGTRFLGSEYALLAGAMSWVSERHLVSAISNAGGFGVLACGAMEPDRLAEEIAATQALTTRPFGVNLITMHPRLDQLVRVCLDAGITMWCWPVASRPARSSAPSGKAGRRSSPSRPRWCWPGGWSVWASMRW